MDFAFNNANRKSVRIKPENQRSKQTVGDKMKIGEMFFGQMLPVVFLFAQVSCLDRSHYEECAKELDLKPDAETGAVSKSADVSCLMKCVYAKQGSITADGRIVAEKHHEILRPYLVECDAKANATDACARLLQIDDCLDETVAFILRDIIKHCSRVTKTEYEHGDLSDYDDYDKACFHRCSMQALELLDEHGEISYVNLILKGDYLYKGNVEKTIGKCELENTQDDPCVRSMKRVNCFFSSYE